MEFTTPPSYGSTVVTVGCIAKDGEIIIAGCEASATHKTTRQDSENDWKEPKTVEYKWAGTTKDGKKVEASIEGDLEDRLDRIDVMAEVPGFVKKIVAGTVRTKPYIYQVCCPAHHPVIALANSVKYMPRKPKLNLKLKIGDEPEVTAEGDLFAEATFICE